MNRRKRCDFGTLPGSFFCRHLIDLSRACWGSEIDIKRINNGKDRKNVKDFGID